MINFLIIYVLLEYIIIYVVSFALFFHFCSHIVFFLILLIFNQKSNFLIFLRRFEIVILFAFYF